MKMYKAMTWQHETTGTDGNVRLFGVNIFDHPWQDTGERVSVKDFSGNEMMPLPVYRVMIDGEERQFAAVEVSNCVWAFFIRKF